MIVVEIGAYDGSLLSIPAAQDGNNEVYAIEAIPEFAARIRSHNLPNLHVFCLEISELGNQSKSNIHEENLDNSSSVTAKSVDVSTDDIEQLQEVENIKVSVMGLDEFIEQNAIAQIDYLKINTPGSYFQVIKSAGKYLQSIKKIILSLQFNPLYEGSASKNEIVSFLTNRGFRLASCNAQKEGLEVSLEFIRISRYPLNSQQNDIFDVKVPYLGTLSTPKNDHVGHLLEQGVFEGVEQAFVWLYLQPGDTFFDCGAHIGLFSAIAAKRLNNQGRIVGFDPNQECIQLYQRNLNQLGCKCFTALNIGLSNNTGEAELLLGKAGMSAFSTFAPGASNHSEIGSESMLVEQRSLDEIISELGVEEVTLAKLDVEGWESFVLEGAKKSIESRKFPLWMIEFTEANAVAASSSTKELRTLIESFGYTLCFFDATNFRLLPELPKPQYPYENLFAVMDVGAVNKRLENANEAIMEQAKDIISRWDTASDTFMVQQMYSQQLQKNQELASQYSQQIQKNQELSSQTDTLKAQYLSEIDSLQQQLKEELQQKERLQETIQEQLREQLQKQLQATHLSQMNKLEQQLEQELQQQLQQQREELQESIEKHIQIIQNTEEAKEQQRQINSQLERQIQELKFNHSQLVTEINQYNEELKAKVEVLQASNQHLHEEIAFLSTDKAAIRKLIKSLFHKLKIFDLIYRNYNFFVPIYNFIFADAWKPSTIFRPATPTIGAPISIPDTTNINTNINTDTGTSTNNTNQDNHPTSGVGSTINLDSSMIEAVVTLRNFAEDVDFEAVNLFSVLISDVKNVLCINPSHHVKHLLFMLSKAKAKVICITSAQQHADLLNCGVQVFNSEMSEWMLSTKHLNLVDYDALILDAETSPATLSSLKGRLSPDTKVIVAGKGTDSKLIDIGWDSPQTSPQTIVEGLHFYSSPPKTWLYPFASEIKSGNQVANQLIWPWKASIPSFPETMPSGKPWPKISVVTVTLNQGEYLEETIRSILLQGYPNLEYIILDGGSTDNTPAILNRYHSELAYCLSEPDKGQSNAINKGFNQATGEILAWLNSDDRYLRDTLFRVAIAFDTYNTDIIAGGCQLIQGNQPQPFETHHNLMPLGKSVPLPLDRLLDIDNCWQKAEFFYQPEVFWTRQIWEKSGAALDENLYYSMDYELWVRMAINKAKITHIPDPLALYRVHESQKTYGDNIPFLPELKGVSAKYKKLVSK
ncbi:MAG: FkbM family methyltransferase [Cyanobacteria bacterium P01_A01_bin.84]